MLWCLNIFFSFCRLAKGHWPEDYLEALEQDKSFDSFEVFESALRIKEKYCQRSTIGSLKQFQIRETH